MTVCVGPVETLCILGGIVIQFFCTCVRQVDLWGPLYCSPLTQDGGIYVTKLYIGREKEKTRCKQKCHWIGSTCMSGCPLKI